jgi:hypothetical protein
MNFSISSAGMRTDLPSLAYVNFPCDNQSRTVHSRIPKSSATWATVRSFPTVSFVFMVRILPKNCDVVESAQIDPRAREGGRLRGGGLLFEEDIYSTKNCP